MKTTKTKLSALAALLAVVIGVSACGSGSSTKSTADNEIAQAANALKEEMGDKDFNEAASAIKDELAKDEAKETTAAEEEAPAEEEIVTPDESEFKFNYDAVLEGVTITGYTGKAKRIRVPSELGGDPVKKLEGSYSFSSYYPAIGICTI